MDFNSFKEFCINICKNIYTVFVDTSLFYSLKEMYDHLSSFARKALHFSLLLIVLSICFYYPLSHLYSSWENMKNFTYKNKLTRQLLDLSSATKLNLSNSYMPGQNPVSFIKNKLPSTQIPKNQIKSIEKIKDVNIPAELKNFPAKMEAAAVEISRLNLKEVVQYGHQLEQLSNNIKLLNITITEDKEENNYFDVSYTIGFFTTAKKETQPTAASRKNIFKLNKKEREGSTLSFKKKVQKKSQKEVTPLKKEEEQILSLKKIPKDSGFDKISKEKDLLSKPPAPPSLTPVLKLAPLKLSPSPENPESPPPEPQALEPRALEPRALEDKESEKK